MRLKMALLSKAEGERLAKIISEIEELQNE